MGGPARNKRNIRRALSSRQVSKYYCWLGRMLTVLSNLSPGVSWFFAHSNNVIINRFRWVLLKAVILFRRLLGSARLLTAVAGVCAFSSVSLSAFLFSLKSYHLVLSSCRTSFIYICAFGTHIFFNLVFIIDFLL